MNKTQGFTLVELMIAVAIIGILAAIALPSYSRYIERGYLAQTHTELININNLIKSETVKNPSFNIAGKLNEFDENYGKKMDKAVTDRYKFKAALENKDSGRRYRISAVPKQDGYTLAMWIDSLGNAYRCSDEASATAFSTGGKCEPISNKKK